MKNLFACALLTAVSISSLSVFAKENDRDFDRDDGPEAHAVTLAVFGDWPYSQNLLDNAHLLVNSVNTDKEVSLVMHVGDIHSGSMPCTSAGILPAIATANPGWNQA